MKRNHESSQAAFNEMAATDESFREENYGKFVTFSNGELVAANAEAHVSITEATEKLEADGDQMRVDFGIFVDDDSIHDATQAYSSLDAG